MKKFLIFILIAAAAYFAYDYFIREKPVLEIKDNKIITTGAVDIDAPSLTPMRYGSVHGTVKNIIGKPVINIFIKYSMGGSPVETRIGRLDPGQSTNFETPDVIVRSANAEYYLDSLSYEVIQ